MKNLREIAGHGKGENPGRDDPTEESAHEPVGFPGPVLHAPVRNVEAGGGEAAEPVKEDAEYGVWIHGSEKLTKKGLSQSAIDGDDMSCGLAAVIAGQPDNRVCAVLRHDRALS